MKRCTVIGTPLNGVYITLLRSRGQKTIHILRDFDPALYMHHPSEDLRVDMVRLEDLDRRTKEAYEQMRQGLVFLFCPRIKPEI